jgi:hypothetical protein
MIYKDYATIVQIAKKYYKDDNYCTVVALAVAAGIGYGAAFHTYRRLGRVTKKGTRLEMQKAAFAEHGLTLVYTANVFGKTLKTAAECSRAKGTYLVYSSAHVSAVVDGTMYDWATTSRKRVKNVYEIVKSTK